MTIENSPLTKKERYILSGILFMITFMIAVDIYSDFKDGAELGHMATELVIGVVALIGNGFIIGQSFKTQTRLERTKESLERSQKEATFWKASSKSFVEGLSQAIDDQFKKWNFTNSEKEVALLFLKGLSSKEVAQVRGVSDKTIRAQATTIYEKSGLAGRAELSAFFLEDLLTPSSFHKDQE